MKTIELSRYVKCGDPYAIYFVYPKDGDGFVVKGMSREVREYVDSIGPALYRYTFWKDGVSRGAWQFNVGGMYVSKEDGGKYTVTIYRATSIVRTLVLRRMPHKWIPEFERGVE